MPDDLLAELDRSFDRVQARGTASVRSLTGTSVTTPPAASSIDGQQRVPWRDRYPLVEAFVCAQFLWGAFLFVPGAQSFRAVIRALPYLSSLALAVGFFPKRMSGAKPPGSASFAVLAMALLVMNLLHPTTQATAGLAQCVFQFAIIAPVFWAWKAITDERRLRRVIWLVFVLNGLSATLGILQVYAPERFMPPQFSALGMQMNEAWVESLTYVGADGRLIVRPPGLTDQPGGAAIAGTTAAILGLGLSLLPGSIGMRLMALGGATVGLAALYLTQVRSLLMMAVAAFVVMAALMFRRGKIGAAAWLIGGGGALVIASFIWATSVGGDVVQQRYTQIAQTGAVQTFRENRGHFLSYTVGELLDEFPLGAGVGRWGMMQVYFGDPADLAAPPIYVEIQLTGWLLDGGVLMWLLYGGAIVSAFLTTLRLAQQGRSPGIADAAALVLAVMVLVLGMSFAGPVFNTQMGVLFWFLVAALHGAGAGLIGRRPRYF